MSRIDPKLKDLLVREAHLRLSRVQLMPAWSQKEAELRAIQTAKPAFWPVFSRRKREEFEARLNPVQQDVDLLRQGLAVLDRIEPQVKKLILEELENILRADHPEYVEAWAALRQMDDWVRCVGRFAERLHVFAGELGNVRSFACSGYARKANAYSEKTREAFQLAIAAAQKVEEEVVCANKISDARAQIFIASGFKSRALPKLPPTGFAAWVARINTLPPAEAQGQFDQLFARTKKLYETDIPELRAQADAADRQQTSEVQSTLFALWEQLRAQVAPEIFAGDTERIAEETGELFRDAAENTAVGRP